MSDAQFIKVRYKLTDQIAREGGMTAGLASERAARELSAEEEKARQAVRVTISKLEALCKEKSGTMDAVYDLSTEVLDVAGLYDDRPLSEAAYALCELADRLRTQGRADWSAVNVCTEAMKVIWAAEGPQRGQIKSVLEGLWALVDYIKMPEKEEPEA
jgi:hypothetical protein